MRPGHGEQLIAEGDVDVSEDEERLVEMFRRQLDEGMWAAVPDHHRDRPPRRRRWCARSRRSRGTPTASSSSRAPPAARGSGRGERATVTVALCATAIVVLALLWEVIAAVARAPRYDARRARKEARAHGDPGGYDPGRERRAEQRARELLRSCVNEEEWAMYRDLGFLRVWGGQAGGPVATHPSRDLGGVPYAYLIYPHKPILAYLPQTGQLLNEYCVEFPDETRPYGSARLPDSDDVLAKWMALQGDERRLIAEANLHLPGRQVDPEQVQRDLWRLGQWERARLGRAQRREDGAALRPPPRRLARRVGFTAAWPRSTPATTPASSSTAPRAPPPAPSSRASASTTRRSPSRSSASPPRGPRRCPATTRCARRRPRSRRASATPAARRWSSTRSRSPTASRWARAACARASSRREVIADSIELVARGHFFDAVIALAACDKTLPGVTMALARLNLPGMMLYGGSIMPGRYKGEDVTIQEVFEAIGAHAAGRITEQELIDLENVASPGSGACGGQFTANTMAMALEVLGISPMGAAMVPAENPSKAEVAYEAGRLVMDVLARGQRPSDIITKAGLENAIAAIATSGGSTNGVLHLLAIANEAGVELDIDDFDRISSSHADAVRPQARRPLRRRRPAPGGRRADRRPAPAGDGPPQRGRA